MTSLTLVSPFTDDVNLLKLAREIAMDLHDLPDILKRHGLSEEDWTRLSTDQNFLKLLEGEVVAWQAAANTHDRTKLKAAALVEEWLPEANRRIHDPGEALSAKTELAKLLARIADMGLGNANVNGGGERFVVNINLGGDKQLKFTHEVTPQVIEHSPTTET